MTATDADRNAYAAGATAYNGLCLFLEDPLQTTDDVRAPGCVRQAITMGAVGAAGPDPSTEPAAVGTVYSSQVTFTITGDQPARWQGLYVGTTLRRTIPLKSPIGPGTFPFVSTITIA